MMKIEDEVAELARRLEADRELERTEEALGRARRATGGSRIAARLAMLLVAYPALVMALLIVLAYNGIYVEPIRSWWTPQLADLAVFVIALEAVIVTFAFYVTRSRTPREIG